MLSIGGQAGHTMGVDPCRERSAALTAEGVEVISLARCAPGGRKRLDSLGIDIVPLAYDKVWLGGGGIHCSTAPLLRDPVG